MHILDRLRHGLAASGRHEASLWRRWGHALWVWRRDGTRAAAARIFARQRPARYADWIGHDEPADGELAAQRRAAPALPFRPAISVIIGSPHVDAAALHASIASVRAQTYDRWDLRVIGPAPGVSGGTVGAWTGRDARIRAASEGEGPVPPTESGELVVPLRSGDRLAPSALFEIVQVLTSRPELDLVYTDEDTVALDGRTHRDPFFKPDWSPELLLSVNYLTPPAIRRRLFDEAGGVTPPVDEAQIWDLVLRCASRAPRIGHIPRVLYHRHDRRSNGAPAGNGGPDRRVRCVESYLARAGLGGATVRLSTAGVVRAAWAPRGSRVAVVIPNRNRERYLRRCLDSILDRTAYRNFEIVIVDNGSTDAGTLRYYDGLRQSPAVRIIPFMETFNYSRANNLGARSATGELLLFLNNDVEAVDPEWLEELVRWAERPEIGVVGAKLLYPAGGVQHAGIVVGLGGLAEHVYRDGGEDQGGPFGSVNWYRNYMAVTGACMMMRRSVFDAVGGFDEQYRVAGGDVELCLRVVEHGYRIVYTPFARLRHFEGATRGRHAPENDVHRLRERLRPVIDAGDRYFNRNLSSASRIPALKPSR